MLPKDDTKEAKKFVVPPKLKFLYENFELTAETSTYRVFEAKARTSQEKHTIRILDCTKELVKSNFNQTATLFVQELLWLQYRNPGSALINTFEISDDGTQIACATRSCVPLQCQFSENKEVA